MSFVAAKLRRLPRTARKMKPVVVLPPGSHKETPKAKKP